VCVDSKNKKKREKRLRVHLPSLKRFF